MNEEEDIDIKKNVQMIADFLLYFEKDYNLKAWANGGGYDFHLDNCVISINDGGYLEFEVKPEEEKNE